MEKKELSKQLTKAYIDDEYSDFESLNNMIDVIVPEGYIVRTVSDGVQVFDDIEDLELNEDDLTTLRESYRGIDTDDVNIQVVRN